MMPESKSRLATAVALLLCACACLSEVLAQDTLQVVASADQQQFLADAEALLAAGQIHAAYTLLTTRERELAGNPFFDYLLGIAALDSGRHSDAIFSLRRALAVSPGYSGARMELARAYFDSGNTAAARPLFARLLDENPPPAVRTVIDDYLNAIDSNGSTPKSQLQFSFDVAGGYDSNANGSTDNQQFMGFTLSPNNLETESSFVEAGVGFGWQRPTSTRFGWYAGGRASYRHNPDADFVDSGVISGNAGMNWQRGNFFGGAGVEGYWATRDGDPNQSYVGLDALLGGRITDHWDLTISLRGGALQHDDAIETLDVDRLLYSGGLVYRFASGANIAVEVIGGDDSESQAGSPYGNSKRGGRLTVYLPVGNSGNLFASTGALTSEYDGLFFGTLREDTQLTSILQFTFRDVWAAGLSLTPRLRYVDNDSSIALYDYDRTEVGLQLRWMPQ